jgi:hypothetical protein
MLWFHRGNPGLQTTMQDEIIACLDEDGAAAKYVRR